MAIQTSPLSRNLRFIPQSKLSKDLGSLVSLFVPLSNVTTSNCSPSSVFQCCLLNWYVEHRSTVVFFFFFSPVATAQVLILKALGTPTFKHSHHLIKNMGNTTCNIKKCNIEASFQKKEYNIHPNNHCYYYILTFQLIYLD